MVLRVEAGDGSSDLPQAVQALPDATEGRGVSIMDALAAAWGVRAEEAGKTI